MLDLKQKKLTDYEIMNFRCKNCGKDIINSDDESICDCGINKAKIDWKSEIERILDGDIYV